MPTTSKRSILIFSTIFFIVVMLMVIVASRAPSTFTPGVIVDVPKNSSLSATAHTLAQDHIISSEFLFKLAVVIFHSQKSVLAGDYLFTQPQNTITVAYRLAHGDQELSQIKVTIPEGTDVADMATILQKDIPGFNVPYFLKIAHDKEGYLFPDTYYFLPNVTADDVVSIMSDNFNQKIATLDSDIRSSGRSLKDIITMASIVEDEARTTDTRKIIAGILWKRLDKGILLQVDAPLEYITGNTTGYVSLNETKIDSPYNTYKYKGLPPGPITNPGLDSITAVLNPTTTAYYYYLSDKNGVMHYAETFAEHLANKEKYLN